MSDIFKEPVNKEEWEQYRLSDEQVRFFHENGYMNDIKMLEEWQVDQLNEELAAIADPTTRKTISLYPITKTGPRCANTFSLFLKSLPEGKRSNPLFRKKFFINPNNSFNNKPGKNMKNKVLNHVCYMTKRFIHALLLQCITMSPLWAGNGNAQVKSIDEVIIRIGLSDTPIERAFSQIEQQTGYNFVYTNKELGKLQKITVERKRKTLYDLLVEIAAQTHLEFKQVNQNIHVKKANKVEEVPVSIANREVEVKIAGTVVDGNGEPVPGVTVSVPDTGIGTATDIDGKYSLSVPEGSTLVFSFIGFETQRIVVGDQSIIDVTLSEDMASLDEVVVVGYGTQKKSDLTGSVSSVRGEDLEKTPATTIGQALQGRAPGVEVKRASNAPGGGIRIRIRGTNSINASSEPLYVIDGFPIVNNDLTPGGAGNQAQSPDPLSSISPHEIESIEILKDASASAIYGSRGANGVILITTKRGQTGKAQIDFGYFVNVASVRKKLDLVNAEEHAILVNEWAVNNDQPLFYDGIDKPLPEELGEGTDWQDEIFRTALTHNYNLSVSGGTEDSKFMVAWSYVDEDGIIIESNFKRYGLKFNLDQKVNDRINIGINTNASHTINDAVPSDGTGFQNDTPLWSALSTTPIIPVRDEEGNYIHNLDELQKIVENPVSIAKTRTDITYATRVLSNAFADIDIIEGLTFRANFGADIVSSKRNVYVPNTAVTQALPNLGIASVGAVQSQNWLAEYTFTYEKEFDPENRLSVLAGYTAQATRIERLFSRTDDFSTNKFEFNNLGAGSDPRPSDSQTIESGILSYLGRINYVYKDKFLFTGTVRRDGSSRFGEDNKWGVFPSVGLAYRLGEENFVKNGTLFSDLKIRTSYGLTGNQAIGSYSSLALYNTTRVIIGGGPVIGFVPNRIANPDLKWEKTTQSNIGVDAEFLEGKFFLSAEYYIKNTEDLLLNVTIPNQSGYGNSVQNIGEVENKGIELSAGFNTFGTLKWNSSFNISFNRNKVVSLSEGTDRLIFGLGRGETGHGYSIAIPGKPLGSFYGYRFLGIWQTEEEITEAGNSVGGVNRPGLPKYADLNGDGFRQNDDDRTIIGDPNPDFIFGFSNDFSFRNFNLFIFINGSYGNEIYDLNRIGLLTQPQKHNVLQTYYEERWTGPGTSNTIEAPLHSAGEWKNGSNRDVMDGSYLRVKTISLSYNLPYNFLGMESIRNAQIYISGENLFTLTDYTGFDPEVDLYSSSNTQMGVDNGAYPASKGIRIGVKLGL
jgi:TonB-linked SusC/RagA family outer membrane protein